MFLDIRYLSWRFPKLGCVFLARPYHGISDTVEINRLEDLHQPCRRSSSPLSTCMVYVRVGSLLTVVLLVCSAFLPTHLDPLLGPIGIEIRFIIFAGVSALFYVSAGQNAVVALLGSILFAGVLVGLREFAIGAPASAMNLTAVLVGTVWGVAMAQFVWNEGTPSS